MPTRIVTHTVLDPDGNPYPSFPITFTRTSGVAPGVTIRAYTDWAGGISVALETGETYAVSMEGMFFSVGSTTVYPTGSRFEIAVPIGATPITLAEIAGFEAIDPDDPDVQAAIAAFVDAYLATQTLEPGPHTHPISEVGGLTGQLTGLQTSIDATAYALAAHTHAYADLTGKPTLGTAAAQNTTAFATAAQGTKADTAVQPAALAAYSPTAHSHDAVYAALVHTHAWGDITDKPATFAPSAHTQAASTITDFDTEVSNNTDVAANTAARHTHANAAVLNATTASFTTADETKLDGIAAGAEVNVQSDWNAASGDAFIANKPTLGTAAAQNTTAFATAAQGTKADTAVQPAAIANFETTTQLNTRDTNNRARANHTGTQSADTLTDGTTNKAFLATERTKLSGIATGATANATDAQLRDRATHTGAQAISTVTGLQTALDAKADDTDLASYLTTAAAPELIRDTMGTALVAGANVVITPNDGADTITIAASGGGNLVISDTAPTPAAGVSVMWLQTNAGGVPGDFALNLVTGE